MAMTDQQRLAYLEAQVELLESFLGRDFVKDVHKRLDAMTKALNEASRHQRARTRIQKLTRRNREHPGYAEAMENLMHALAETCVIAVGNGRWAVLEHKEVELLRARVAELEAQLETSGG